MVLSSALAIVMMPVAMNPDAQKMIHLETLIPVEFEGWKMAPTYAGSIINPEVKEELDTIYNQTLSRTYVNSQGEHVMLSIAYGGVQKTDMHAHRPEICYSAGGFDVGNTQKSFVETTVGRIPVMHLLARRGGRNETITYWIRVGDTITRGWLEQKLTAIGYGLSGQVPDGILVRVSTISSDEQDSYRVQHAFLGAMLKGVGSSDRLILIGNLSP